MKQLNDLIHRIQPTQVSGDSAIPITGLALDSRKVRDGFLFCAVQGTQLDGHTFIHSAIKQGASAVLCEYLPDDQPAGICFIQSSDILNDLGEIVAEFYDHPSQKIKLIGITGTNGKTSIATWLYQLLSDLGYPTGLLSTIRILINQHEYPATHTTPDSISLNQYLANMVEAGCEFAVMEVSSHALEQKRTAGLHFTGTLFTNLSRDHLDYHSDFKSYLEAKKKLFDTLSNEAFALINSDDKHARIMVQNTQAVIKSFATQKAADFTGRIVEQHPQGMLLQIDDLELWVRVMGQYSASNLLAVYSLASMLGLNKEEIGQAISALKPVEGRLEIVDLGGEITAVVDYAHTPDALKNVLKALNDTKSEQARVITVVGAGGDRDPGKRPKMALAAVAGSSQVILTSDNPRTEDPETILDDMMAGLDVIQQNNTLRISNRREAIKTAVALAKPHDIILVAGKGHENYQDIMGVKHPFDDVDELMKLKIN